METDFEGCNRIISPWNMLLWCVMTLNYEVFCTRMSLKNIEFILNLNSIAETWKKYLLWTHIHLVSQNICKVLGLCMANGDRSKQCL